MSKRRFSLVARVNSDSPSAVKPILESFAASGTLSEGSSPNEFIIEAKLAGPSAKELNRTLLSALRRAEKKTRLRAEWSSGDTTEKFFDYVSKGTRKATTS